MCHVISSGRTSITIASMHEWAPIECAADDARLGGVTSSAAIGSSEGARGGSPRCAARSVAGKAAKK